MKTFELVGYRFSRLEMNEDKFVTLAEETGGNYAVRIGALAPSISKATYFERKVIEARVQISGSFRIGNDDENFLDMSAENNFLFAECIAGFVGQNEKDDGDVKLFTEGQSEFGRSIYWLLRQRLASFLTMTALRTLNLPWDFLDESHGAAEGGSPAAIIARKRKPQPKPRRRKA